MTKICFRIIDLCFVISLHIQCSCGIEIVLWQAQLWGFATPSLRVALGALSLFASGLCCVLVFHCMLGIDTFAGTAKSFFNVLCTCVTQLYTNRSMHLCVFICMRVCIDVGVGVCTRCAGLISRHASYHLIQLQPMM